MKLSAKLVTALAALALLVVAVAGVVSTSSSALAETSSATISLDKAWYAAGDTVTVTVTDADSDTTASATSSVIFEEAGSFSDFQQFTIPGPIGDSSDDGDEITSADFTLGTTDGGSELDTILAVTVNDSEVGFITVGVRSGESKATSSPLDGTDSTEVFISYDTDSVQTLTDEVKITSTQNPTGILISPVEAIAASGGEFTVDIVLSSGTSTTELHVLNGDTITVEFDSGTSSDKDQAKVETTGPTIDVISPADGFASQDQTPTFIVQISDNESGVDEDTILFTVDGVANDFTGVEPSDTTTAGGVITAEFTATSVLVDDNEKGTVKWFVDVDDVAGNSSRTDTDDDDDGDSGTGDSDHTVSVDQVAPNILSAETGTFWDTSIEGDDKTSFSADDDLNSVMVIFDEVLDDADTNVTEADFTVAGITPVTAQVYPATEDEPDIPTMVFLTMAIASDSDATPEVKVVGNIADAAGNSTAVGEVDATDGIAPAFAASLSASLTQDDVTLTITANESITGNVPTIKVSTPDGSDAGLEKTITGIKVTGDEAWEVTIDIDDDALNDGLNAVVITGSDAQGNPSALGMFPGILSDADDQGGTLTFTVDTFLDPPDFTPDDGDAGESPTASSSPFIQIAYAEEVTLTAATFATADGDAVDILVELSANTADNKLFVLAPGSYPGGASTLALDEHTITVSAIDAAGNESEDDTATFEIEEREDFELPLIAGWNLVSLPGVPSDPSINAVITIDEVGTVITFDPTVAGNFLTAVRDSSTNRLSGSLSTIDAQHGYWVNTTSFDPIEVFILPIPAVTLPPTVPVLEGYNLIPVVDVSGDLSAGDGLTGVATYLTGVDFSKVYRYAPLTGRFAAISGATTVEVGEGLWVFVNEAGTITP